MLDVIFELRMHQNVFAVAGGAYVTLQPLAGFMGEKARSGKQNREGRERMGKTGKGEVGRTK